jgi:hypothetical protein
MHMTQKAKKSPLDKLNEELASMGIDEIKDVDPCPERTYYFKLLEETDFTDKKEVSALKGAQEAFLNAFHNYFASVYAHLLFEIGEDKIYWLYNDTTGVYDEMNFSTVRGLILKLMIEDGLQGRATEMTAKTVLARYRSLYAERGCAYEDFDSNSGWFHAKNGWIDVKTLKFVGHSPERLSRRVSDVVYDKKAVCPMYDKFLDEQMQLQKDQVRVIDQFSGLLLTPDITKQKMLVLVGKPGCGKSTLLDLWSDVLGDCATQKGLNEIASESFRFGGSTLVGKTMCGLMKSR